ncbi:MAG TPA: efflux RND transporter periplasmic adaptor subunit [Gammaproteobacteria bacterium]|nr:efflux RND transporter periplasmic adaptor subunit [Gammaproteobacteria bacterium]
MTRSEKNIMLRATVVVVLLLVVLFGVKAWLGYRAHAALAHRGAFSVSVSAAQVGTAVWQQQIHAVANLVAVSGVHLTPQLPGQITGIYFHSGEYVRKGQRLVQIDDSNQRAQFASDQASAELARINYQRAKGLYQAHATSHAVLDTARASYANAQASVANDRATLAKLALSAPFSGWMGVREVSLGEYLTPGTEIAALNVWDPLRAEFTVPQNELGLIHTGQSVVLGVNTFPGKTFDGRVIALDSEVDPSTRNITVDAIIPNPGHLLRPGMFGEAELLVGAAKKVLVVPVVALTYNTFGDFVYVVRREQPKGGKPMLVAVATTVTTGETRDGMTEILSGLKAGETIVATGQIKLRSGMPVNVQPTAAH